MAHTKRQKHAEPKQNGIRSGIKGLYEKRGWYYYQPPTPTKGGKRPPALALRTQDLMAAMEKLQEHRTELMIEARVRAGTMEEVLPAYYATRAGDTKSTRLAREVILTMFKTMNGNPRLDAIDADMINDWRAKLRDGGGKRGRPLSATTLRSYLITLRAFLAWAHERKLIRSHPLPKMDRSMRVGTTRVQAFFSEEERERLLAAESPEYVRLILHLGFFAGLRLGEMLAFRKEWLWFSDDMTRGTLTVQATPVRYTDGRQGVWRPKSGKRRVIPLHPRLLAFLQSYGMREPWMLAPKKELWPADGKKSLRFDAKKAMAALAKETGIPKLGYHVLRHSFATHLAMKGVALAEIAGLLGNSLKVTEDHYAGFSPSKTNPLEVL